MKKNYKKNNYNKIQKFSIRKYSFGAASVAIASYLMFMGNGAVFADEATVTENTAAKTEEVVTTGEPKKEEAPKVVGTEIAEEKAQKELVASKEKLASYVKEIEGNLSSGKYESKTEESLALLRDAISKANQAANATTKVEVEKAYANLITTVNAKLKSKPVEKKETQAVDTTNGKETVGKKAENTEKKSDSNSIDNTGSKDSRNGKVMDKDNAFRTEATAATHEATTNKVGNISYTMEFSDDAKKEIYLYNQEDTNVDITVNSTAGNISSVKVRGGGNRPLDEATKDSAVQIDGFGWSYKQTLTETPGPVTMNITGKTNERFLGLPPTNRREDQNSVLGDRYLVITDAAGGSVSASSNGVNQPGYFKLVVKSQTYKYSIQQPAVDGDKIGVDDINNLTTADIEKIKNQINIEYSKTSTDARLSSKKGTALENKSDVVKNIEVNGGNITVTYKDDSTDTATISSVVRNNVAPTVSIPYSDPAPNKKEVYLYTGEESNVEITFNDDSGKIKSAALKKGGNIALNNVAGNPDIQDNEYGFTVTAINSESATPAKIKVTGQVSGIAENRLPKTENDSLELVTRFATATDKDGKYIINNAVKNKNNGEIVGTYLTDPGAVTFVLKAQAKKYDMVTPTEADKVAVADPTAVTDEEFAKIKAQLEYSRTNEDKNLESKRGEKVDNTDNKIATITKEGNYIVATYKDGSKDVRPLSDFTKLDKQPAIDAVNTATTEKIAAINATPNATDEEKAVAIAKVNADKEKALTAINDATAKAALDTAKESGTNAIAADNPVVAKKDEAKKAIEAALTAKNNVIDGRDDLTPAQKTAAKEKAAEEAKKAKEAVDAATTDAAVDQAKTAGETAVAAVTPVAKEPAKQAIAKALEDKNAELEKRTDLTAEEKAKAKEEAKNLADAQLAEIDKQPDAAATPEAAQTAQTAVDAAKTKGVDDVTAVNPVAAKKTAAKQAIEAALTAKNNAIDGRDDLTPAQKTAAKEKAAEEAKKAKEAIDAATTDAAVDQAKTAGETAVAAVTPVAKEPAKKAIAKALEDKNAEIEKRTDLTDEEKAKAKEEAKNLADAQLAEIAKQPDVAATPEAAQTAQTAVDAAKTKGVADVTAVNPVAAKKPAAKKAIEDALTAKNNAIDGRTDLTPEEKQAAKDKAAEEAKNAKEAIDAATTDAAVDQAKTAGETAVAAVTPVAKEPAKQAIAKALEDKNAEIEKRTDLTADEKAKAKEEAKKLADAQLAEIAKQPDAAETPEAGQTAQTAVDAAKKTGVDDVTAVNPEAVTKPAAKKAIDDKLAEQLKTIENTPDATEDEKKVAAEQAKTLAELAKKEIDNKTTDADVNQFTDTEKAEIEKVLPVVEDKPNARKAIDEEATAKKEAIEARTDLTPKAKEDLKAEVDKLAKEAKKAVDNATTTDEVNGVEEAGKTVIQSVGAVNIPANKVLVNDPSALTDEEKAKVLEAVKKVNPDAKEITQDADGNVTVTTPDGHKEIITPEQVVKTSDTANEPKAGNDVVKPADKVVVADPTKLTDAEKEKIKAAVKAVNPNSVVTVDEKGNAKVSTQDGQTQVIPVDELVRTAEDTKKPNAGNDIVKPADKTVVANPDALTPEEKKAIEDKVKAVNPGATVVVDDKGNATVTTPEGKTAVIPSTDLVKSPEDATKPNAGNDIVKPADKTAVANKDALTPEEKKAIEDKVKAVNPGATVVVDDKGNATVTTPEGKTAVIPASDLTKTAEEAAKPNAGNDIVKPADKTVVSNSDALTPEEKKAIEDKVKAVNPGATVVVDDKGNATVTTPEGKTAVIPASDLVKSQEEATKPNAGNDIVKPADKTVVANPDALTPEEKKAIEDKVKAVNPGATVVVDDKGNATVTTPLGNTAVIPATDLTKSPEDAAKPNAGNDIVKPADKTVVANPDALTPEEKKAIEDKVKAVNSGATVVVDDKGNATVTTPEGKTAVIPATDLVKSQEDATKPNAGNDIVKPADKTVVANPDALTPEEKKAIEDKVKAVNPDATVVVDDKGNATVTTPEGKTAVIPASDLTKSAADAAKPNAGNDVNTPAAKTVVANPDVLTPEEKKAIEDKVKAVNPGATVVVDDKGNATVTTADGKKTAVIPASALTKTEEEASKPNAGNDINTPSDKTVVANPDSLTPEEKKAIEDKVKAVNPGATVVVDDKGNATVTTADGKKTAVIPASALTKTAEAAKSPNAGNDINTPADKTVVANPDSLTPEEKKAIEDKVKAVNPGATVVVDDKGNATVTTADGKTAVIPASNLVIPKAKLTDLSAQSGINTPATRTLVANKDSLTPEEIAKIKAAVEEVNPGAIVVVDAKGNATVTTKDGVTATIAAEQLVKDAKDVAAKNDGENINLDFEKQVVFDLNHLTDTDKAGAKAKIMAANPDVAEVIFDDKGNATVILKNGKSYTVLAKYIFKQYVPSSNASEGNSEVKVDKTKLELAIHQLEELVVKFGDQLTEDSSKEAKDLLAQAKEVFNNPNATQAEVDAMVKRIEDFVARVSKGKDGQSSGDEVEKSHSEENNSNNRENSKSSNSKQSSQKELPNTGTSTFGTILPAMAALLSGVGLFAKKKKEDE